MSNFHALRTAVAFVCFGLAMAGAPAAAGAENGAEDSRLRFRLPADPATLDWNLARSSHETYLIMNLMEGLVEEGPDLKVRPALAESWDVSADGRTYTFKLRGDVKWSDGRALKASDFEDSWIRLLDPKTKSTYATFLFDLEGAEAYHHGKASAKSVGVKATGPQTLQVRLKQRVPHFLHLATFWVTFPIRSDLIRKHGTGWATPGKIVTLGPYLLSSWEKGRQIGLKRNTSYFGANAGSPGRSASEVEILIEPDDQRARELFEAGKTDFLLGATTQDLLKARGQVGGGDSRVEQYPYLATYFLTFNCGSGPLRDRAIRAAIASAIDRERIPSVLQGGQVVANSYFPPGIDGHSPAKIQLGTLYDARATFTKAGYPEGQRFPVLPFWVEKFDGAELVAKAIAQNLQERLGLTLEIRYGTPADYKKDPDGAIFLTHWGADYPDARNFLEVYAGGAGYNFSRWNSPEFDGLLDKARKTADSGERLVAYAAAERILLEKEVVLLPLFYKRNTVLLGKKIRDFRISPLNYLFLKDVTLQAPSPR